MKIVILLAVLALSSHTHHKIGQTSSSLKHSKLASKAHHVTAHSRGRHSHQPVEPPQSRAASKKHRHVQAKARYAYPMSLFLYQPPPFDSSPLPENVCSKIRKAFVQGTAGDYPTRSLVKAGLVSYYPLRGGIFFRRELIKNIIVHSTEPGIPVSAKTVIDGWSHGGRRHPGAHYVVERDGTIYQSLDPDLAAVHVNIFKTLPGFDNDNSVGIEMCHQGSQNYPAEQVQSVVRLVVYLQNHYHVSDSNVVTHRYAQQGDHTDPVNFAWNEFIADKTSLQNQALNYRLTELKTEAVAWQPIEELGVGKAKIFKGNKPVVIDLTKAGGAPVPVSTTSSAPAVNEVADETVDKSTLTPPLLEPSNPVIAAPIPSSAGANLVPTNSGAVSRLVPVPPVHRLVPTATIINNGALGTAGSAAQMNNIDEAIIPDKPANSQSTKVLPLRGPIEMDPNEAADLLEDPALK